MGCINVKKRSQPSLQPPFSDSDKEVLLRKLLFISSSHANTILYLILF